MFDRVALPTPLPSTPSVLYHYTSAVGAEGIISSQQFWATAHHCTNDTAELSSADTTILEVATDLRRTTSGTAARVLDVFLANYAKAHVLRSITVCLACFTTARDDHDQWRKYGDDGRGICLGIRLLNEPGPKQQASALMQVDYSEPSWSETIRTEFGRILEFMAGVSNIPKNVALGASALKRQAAFQAIIAKRAEWAGEQEFRHVTLVADSASDQLKSRPSETGAKVYFPVVVRANNRPIAFAEILIGPNNTSAETQLDWTSS